MAVNLTALNMLKTKEAIEKITPLGTVTAQP